MRGAARRSCTGAKPHTSRPAQPRRRSPASTSSRALPPSPVTTPIERGSAGRGEQLLRLEQALVVQLAPQPLDLGQQLALAGHLAAPVARKMKEGEEVALPA